MSEPLPEFDVLRPASIDEAVAMAAENPASRYVAGGSDLIVNMRRGLVDADVLIDLSAISALNEITITETGVMIGAGTSLAALAGDPHLCAHYGAIAQAAGLVAGPGHREVGTIGGNLCLDTRCIFYNQSQWWRKSNSFCLKHKGEICHVAPGGNECWAPFCGDLAPALLVHDAQIEIAGPGEHKARKRMALAELYSGDGADPFTLPDGMLLVAVHVPTSTRRSRYEKTRVRGSIDFPLAGVAVAVDAEGEIRIALTGTGTRPQLVEGLEKFNGQSLNTAEIEAIGKLTQKLASPMRTSTISPRYRRVAAAALAKRLVVQLADVS